MTEVLADSEAEAPAVVEESPATDMPVRASWLSRAGAFSVDVLFGIGVIAVFMAVAWSARVYSLLWWVCVLVAALVFLAILANRVVLPVITGWTVGRSLFGIAVVRRDGLPNDPWRLLLRDIAHLLDTIPLPVGWFWPLWDSRGRTFADILTRTEVHRVEGHLPDHRRLAGKVIAGLALLAVLGAALGVLGVTLPDRAVKQAREQIAEQGPKIVPDVLSYSAANVQADFERAQALVTDGYRPQLIAQQDAVRKMKPILDNNYWVTNSAVLSSTRDHALMLLLMQGQRGEGEKQRFITATVKASFEKSRSGQWQLADLAVLAQPAPPVVEPAPKDGTKPAPPKPSPAAPKPSKQAGR